jgi:hypothetical protein
MSGSAFAHPSCRNFRALARHHQQAKTGWGLDAREQSEKQAPLLILHRRVS